MLTLVIDTSVMMVSLSPRSNLHWLYQALINGDYQLVVSNEILLEYEEQIRYRYDSSVVAGFLLILAEAPNVLHHEPYFKWQLITADKDDNKFANTCISSASNYLITHDKHFDVLKQISFPVVSVVDSNEFEKILRA